MVKCNTCKKEYESMLEHKNDQAYGCSATLYLSEGQHYIVGSYGSKVADMHKYMLQSSTEYEVGSICDDCITKLIDQKVAIFVEDGVW